MIDLWKLQNSSDLTTPHQQCYLAMRSLGNLKLAGKENLTSRTQKQYKICRSCKSRLLTRIMNQKCSMTPSLVENSIMFQRSFTKLSALGQIHSDRLWQLPTYRIWTLLWYIRLLSCSYVRSQMSYVRLSPLESTEPFESGVCGNLIASLFNYEIFPEKVEMKALDCCLWSFWLQVLKPKIYPSC